MKHFLTLIVACMVFVSCKTTHEYQTETKYVHDTLRIVNVQKDSIFMHDSVFVNQYTQGDTIYREVQKWHTIYKDRIKCDTLVQVRDSIVYRDAQVVIEKKQPAIFRYVKLIVIAVLLLFFCSWLWKATK